MSGGAATGPLTGLRILEIAAKGPVPYCGMLLSDMGADVVRIDRTMKKGRTFAHYRDPLTRGRRSIAIDLKRPEGVATVLNLVGRADALLEGYRPGVMERLGLGPDPCLARNPKLVYGRATGWGQTGPLAEAAGHDLNYMAVTGVLNAIGDADRPPPPPLALIADFGGGGLFLALGIMAALHEANRSGRGQVVDAAMVDGVASQATFVRGLHEAGWWQQDRQTNMLDGGAPFYNNYETRDGRFVSISAIEPEFYDQMVELLGLPVDELPKRWDRDGWPAWRAWFRDLFLTRTRDEWCALLEGTDICFAPVLDFAEAPDYPQNRARDTFVEFDGQTQAAPAPRFSRTPGAIQRGAMPPGANSRDAMLDWGLGEDEVTRLLADGIVAQN